MPSKETTKQMLERLSKRVEKIRREAGERVTKDALVQCRVEVRQMDELQEIAGAKGLSVSALTRMWLLERLQQEKSYPGDALVRLDGGGRLCCTHGCAGKQ